MCSTFHLSYLFWGALDERTASLCSHLQMSIFFVLAIHFADYTSRSSGQWPYDTTSGPPYPQGSTGYSLTEYSSTDKPPYDSTQPSTPGYSDTGKPSYSSSSPSYPGYSTISKHPYSSSGHDYPGYQTTTWSPRWQHSTTAGPNRRFSTTSMPYYTDTPCRQVDGLLTHVVWGAFQSVFFPQYFISLFAEFLFLLASLSLHGHIFVHVVDHWFIYFLVCWFF